MEEGPSARVEKLLKLYSTAGLAEYHGEKVSQLEHALQAAHLAQSEGGTEEVILASLLHDVGHVWPEEEGEEDGRELTSVGVINHAEIGAKVLRKLGFSAAVADIVEGHVNAKRYLVGHDAEYRAKLSEASVESLRRQGGPMSDKEASDFSRAPLFKETVQIRKWDDRAKIPGASVPGLDNYRDMMIAHLSKQTKT